MKPIKFDQSVEFIEIFWHDGVYSPFEFASNWKVYYPLAILGEIGTLLNNYCKQIRSPNIYSQEIENDCADIFSFLLMFGRMLDKISKKKVLLEIKRQWDRNPSKLSGKVEFVNEILTLTKNILQLLEKDNYKHYNKEYFLKLFISTKTISKYLTGKAWQEIIDNFHLYTLNKFTQFDNYTPDLWYRGSCYVDFSKLLEWVEYNKIQLPRKRILFLQRMRMMQKRKR